MIYRIVTYSKATDRMSGNLHVPPAMLGEIKGIAGVQPQDDGLGDYRLDDRQAREIGRILGFCAEPDSFYYFLEPYEPIENDGLQQSQAEAK